MFAALREPPERGSLRESILMLYVLKKEQVEHARLRALAQAIINKDKAQAVFEEYMKLAFPWIETAKKRETKEHTELLLNEIKRGGLVIKPLWQATRMKSRLRTKIIERSTPKTKEEMNRLYDKLGKVIPT
jgi:predicted aldo/keto reductase-like oxidoreductase